MEGPGEPQPVTLPTAADVISHADQREIIFLKLRLGWASKQHKSPLAISWNCRWFGTQRGTTARSTNMGGNYAIQANFGGNPETTHKSPFARLRDYRLAGNSERRLQPSKARSLTLEGYGEAVTFVLFAPFFCFCLPAMFFTAGGRYC